MCKSGVVLACFGLLVCFTSARILSFDDTIKKNQDVRFEEYEALAGSVVSFTSSRRLQQSGSDLNLDLIVASAAGDTSVVQQLLDSGADPNYITSDGKETALVVAAANNHGDVIQLLLQGGASVHLKVDGFCPLAFAILMDSVEAVRALVAGGADPNEDMHTAAAYSSGPVLLALIQGGGDVNLVSSKGITVLVIAAYYGNQEAIEVLVENGADKAKTGGVGVLPRDVLCKCTVASEISHTCQADKCESPQKMISLLTPID